MIISIGIGPQGALPGSALYSGATCEGIGRFIYQLDNKLDKPENIAKKAQLSKICTLLFPYHFSHQHLVQADIYSF